VLGSLDDGGNWLESSSSFEMVFFQIKTIHLYKKTFLELSMHIFITVMKLREIRIPVGGEIVNMEIN